MKPSQRIYNINKVCDNRGSLSFATIAEDIPFDVKRIFWITDVPDGATRGGHAHSTCHELLFVVNGAMTLHIGDESFRLTRSDEGVAIWAGEWCELKDFAPETVIVVLASEEYNPSGYINSREEYEKFVKSRCYEE